MDKEKDFRKLIDKFVKMCGREETRTREKEEQKGYPPLDKLLEDINEAYESRAMDNSEAILHRIRHLLSDMKSQQGDQPFLVPFQSVFRLCHDIFRDLSPVHSFHGIHREGILFLGKVLELLLSSGVDLRSATIETDREATYYAHFSFDVVRCLAHDELDFQKNSCPARALQKD